MTVVKFPGKRGSEAREAQGFSDPATMRPSRSARAARVLPEDYFPEVPTLLLDPSTTGRGKRVQIRLPLDNEEEAMLALCTLLAGCERSIRVLQSAARQRNPQLHDPLNTVRGVFERINKAINARHQGR